MTQEEFIELMDKAIVGEWVEDCQFPYDCHSKCHCQGMRRSDGAKQKVTIEERGNTK